MSEWANGWVKYHTGGQGNYVTTAMEDTGTLQSLTFLHAMGRVDKRRVLILRTASNFDQQRDGITAAESLAETKIGSYVAYLPAVDAAHRVASVVVQRTGPRMEHVSRQDAVANAEWRPQETPLRRSSDAAARPSPASHAGAAGAQGAPKGANSRSRIGRPAAIERVTRPGRDDKRVGYGCSPPGMWPPSPCCDVGAAAQTGAAALATSRRPGDSLGNALHSGDSVGA